MSKTSVGTLKGKIIDFLEPDPSQIDIEDIAHNLSHVARWAGTTNYFYSVAQHTLACVRQAPARFQLQCLMHDSAEAYIGDIARPLKTAIGPSIKEIENRLLRTIGEKFGVELVDLPPEVIEIDNRMLVTESMFIRPTEAHNAIPILPGTSPFIRSVILPDYSPKLVKATWLATFYQLIAERQGYAA